MSVLRAAVGAGSVVVLLLVSAGCGSEADRPAYATEAGPAGAEKFAGYWVEQVNAATRTGETGELRAMAGPGCETCVDFARQLEEIYGAGGHVESKDWQVDQVVREAGATDRRVGLMVAVTVPPQTVYPTRDAQPEHFPGGDQRFRMIVTYDGDSWTIQELSPR